MGTKWRDPAAVIEDLEFLDESAAGATEAAERAGFPNTQALEKWLERHDAYDLWLSFKRREAPGTNDHKALREAKRMTEQTTDVLSALLAKAERSGSKRIKAKAAKIRTALDDLRAVLDADAEKEQVRKEVERLERQLREARARLNGKTTPSTPSGVAPSEVRAWAKENGVECPAMGRVPQAVVEAYEAAQMGEAS